MATREEIDRLEAMGYMYPEDAARARLTAVPAASYEPPEGPPAPMQEDPFAEINRGIAAAEDGATGVAGAIPDQPMVEGFEMVEPGLTPQQAAKLKGHASTARSVSRQRKKEAAAEAGATAGGVSQQRMPAALGAGAPGAPRGVGAGGLGRRARAVTEAGAGELARIGMERGSLAEGAAEDMQSALDEMSSAHERAAEVHQKRSSLISEMQAQHSRDMLDMRQYRMNEQEKLNFARDRAQYWNYEGTDEELRRDIMLASGTALKKARQQAVREGELYEDDPALAASMPEAADHLRRLEEDTKAAQERLAEAEEVDKGRVIGGVWSTILSALAMGMGAFGAALTGGPNMAMQIINKAIDRDIKAQLENRQGKRYDMKDAQTLFEQNMALYQDEIAAAQATRAMTLEAAAAEIEGLMLRSQGALDEARGIEMATRFRDQKKALEADLVSRGTELQMRGLDFDLKARELAQRAAAQRAAGGGKVPVPMQDKMGSAKAFHQFLGRAKAQFEEVGKWDVFMNVVAKAGPEEWEDAIMATFGAQDGAEYKKQFKQLALLYTKATQGSRPSDYDQKNVESILASIYTPKGMGREIFERMENDAKNQMASNIMAMKLAGVNTAAYEMDFLNDFRVTPEKWLSGGGGRALVPSWERSDELGWSGQSFQPVDAGGLQQYAESTRYKISTGQAGM